MSYELTTIYKENYCDSSEVGFIAYITSTENDDAKIELTIKGLKEEKEIEDFIGNFNNPLRLNNTYPFEKNFGSEVWENNKRIFTSECIRNEVHILAKCINKQHLLDFINYLNNPQPVDIDMLIKEHSRLEGMIDNKVNELLILRKEQQMLRYRILTNIIGKDYGEKE